MSEEKWAVVTGASQGIGRAMAAEAARRGLNLMAIALPGTGMPGVAEELSQLYEVDTEYWEIDLADRDAVAEFAEFVDSSHRVVELLVNNAGMGGTEAFSTQSSQRQAKMIDVNVAALTVLTRLLLPHLASADEAHILNVASLAGWYPSAGMAVYAATKAYVISFSLALREELRGTAVSVSVLCPSGVITKEAIVKALFLQGFWGWATSRYPDQLARFAIPRAYRCRRLLVPGVLNRMLRIAGRLAPLRLVTRTVGRRFSQSRPDHVSAATVPARATIAGPGQPSPA